MSKNILFLSIYYYNYNLEIHKVIEILFIFMELFH